MKDTITLAREAGMGDCGKDLWAAWEEELERLRALIIEDLASGAGEPVAWLSKNSVIVDGLWETQETISLYDDGGQPLYTSPQPAQPVTAGEPAAWMLENGAAFEVSEAEYHKGPEWAPLYTTDQLAAAVAQAVTEYDGLMEDHQTHLQELWDAKQRIAELESQLAAARQDAERYNFLVDKCRSTSEHWGGRWSIIVDGPAPTTHDSADDFNEAIDAAMQAAHGIGEQK